MEMKRKLSGGNDDLQNRPKKTNYLTETFFANFISVPQLESVANVKVVTMLCMLPDIRDAMMKLSRDLFYNEGKHICDYEDGDSDELERIILNKLSLLSLPDLVKVKVSHVIRPIVLEILKWLDCIASNEDSIKYSTLKFLCWTSQGIVDKKSTLKQLIETNYGSGLLECKRTAQKMYELACTYCLEDIIHSLWEKLAERKKISYLNNFFFPDFKHYHFQYMGQVCILIVYWSCVNNNELSELHKKINKYVRNSLYNWEWEHSFFNNMFSFALHTGNILSVKYFWEKLTAEEIVCNLEQWVNEVVQRTDFKKEISNQAVYQLTNEYADILFFLLSKLSVETQREVILKNIRVILKSLFLFWPYQRFFLPTIETVWDSLDGELYLELLKSASDAVHTYDRVYEFEAAEAILKELCRKSPINLKQYFIHDIIKDGVSARCTLMKLLAIGDMKTVEEMMSYANVEEQKQIVENMNKEYEWCEIIRAGKLNVLDKFFQETSLLESDIINLKQHIGLKFGSKICISLFSDNSWQIVKKFLKWAFTSEEQINYFKYNIMNLLDKTDITYQFLEKDNYKCANKFLNWCFCSEQEINEFKQKLPTLEIMKVIGKNDWFLFEKFIAWSSLSEQEINGFKMNLLQSEKLKEMIFTTLVSEYPKSGQNKEKHSAECIKLFHNFQFVNKLINWCCHSNKEIQLYKEECILSDDFLKVARKCMNNSELWENLCHSFSPISEEGKLKLTENLFGCNIRSRTFSPDYINGDETRKLYHFAILNIFIENTISPGCLKLFDIFQLLDKLINWCFRSNEEIQLQFKEEYVLSDDFFKIAYRFKENLELLKKLFNFFFPISEEGRIKFEENITNDAFFGDIKEYVLHLLDGGV